MKKIFKLIRNRIYSDYLMPSRLKEYEMIISFLKKNGYRFLTLKEYKNFLDIENLKGKYLINRHDIDTDLLTAKAFFEIEKKYGVKASYYFRLSTLDIDFMKEIEEYGSEASYHFEEIATFAKENHIKSKDEIFNRMDEIKKLFKQNFINIESKLGYKLLTVCSHGDFVNRKLKIVNNKITDDKNLRKELEIIAEAYDDDIMNSIDVYLSDGVFSIKETADNILKRIENKNVIYMLTHPRQWRVSWKDNTIENIKRFYEGIIW